MFVRDFGHNPKILGRAFLGEVVVVAMMDTGETAVLSERAAPFILFCGTFCTPLVHVELSSQDIGWTQFSAKLIRHLIREHPHPLTCLVSGKHVLVQPLMEASASILNFIEVGQFFQQEPVHHRNLLARKLNQVRFFPEAKHHLDSSDDVRTARLAKDADLATAFNLAISDSLNDVFETSVAIMDPSGCWKLRPQRVVAVDHDTPGLHSDSVHQRDHVFHVASDCPAPMVEHKTAFRFLMVFTAMDDRPLRSG